MFLRDKYKHKYAYVGWDEFKDQWFLNAHLLEYCNARLKKPLHILEGDPIPHFLSPFIPKDTTRFGSFYLTDDAEPQFPPEENTLLDQIRRAIPHGPSILVDWRDSWTGYSGNTYTLMCRLAGPEKRRGIRVYPVEDADKEMESILGVSKKEWMKTQDWDMVKKRWELKNKLAEAKYNNSQQNLKQLLKKVDKE